MICCFVAALVVGLFLFLLPTNCLSQNESFFFLLFRHEMEQKRKQNNGEIEYIDASSFSKWGLSEERNFGAVIV